MNATSLDLTTAIDVLIREADLAALPAWDGAPLHFTTGYHHPEQLDAARERYIREHGHFDSYNRSHMWHRALCGGILRLTGHTLDTFSADLRCPVDAHPGRVRCECLGDLIDMAVCARCRWHAIGAENDVIEAWHDHAFPGWRTLPVLPRSLRGRTGTTRLTPKLQAWLEHNYPHRFQTPGAPILTIRPRWGTRHVPAYSPYGGYDLCIDTDPEPPTTA